MKRRVRAALGLALAAVLAFGGAPAAFAGTAEAAVSTEEMSADVSEVLVRNIPKGGLRLGTSEGEWTVIALARAGRGTPAVYDAYYRNVAAEVQNDKGMLSETRYTEYSRAILGLTAIGRDPHSVGGYDLVQPLADYDKVVLQGINGPIWALIALDSGKYGMPERKGAGGTQNSRDKMVDFILSDEIGRGSASAGGWALAGSEPDPDVTAMALQALSRYRSRSDVQAAVSRAVRVLSALQKDDGGYVSWGAEDSESVAQVLEALTALGISPESGDFVKNGHTLLSALAEYDLPGQGFKHARGDSSANGMATDQCACALAACNRFRSHQNPLYDMTDVVPAGAAPDARTFLSDTTGDFLVRGAYVFKITSRNGTAPGFVVGTPGVFGTRLVKRDGSDYYFQIRSTGRAGAKAGIYVNGCKVAVAAVGGAPSVVSDTTAPFRVKPGRSYVFRLTADAKPGFAAGTGSAFRVSDAGQSGRNYFFRVTAVGKTGMASGFYINGEKTPVAVATIST